eukprot:37953_1
MAKCQPPKFGDYQTKSLPENHTQTNVDPEDLFDIIHPLGSGSSGMIYKALDKRDGELCAIKILPHWNDDDHLNETHQRIMNANIQILKMALKNCPYHINYKEVFIKEDNSWLIMDYCIASVRDIMTATHTNIKECHIKSIIQQTLCALKSVHSQNIIFPQIKASKIMIYNYAQTSEKYRMQLLMEGYIRQQNVKYKLWIPIELVPLLSSYYMVAECIKLTNDERIVCCREDTNGCVIGTPYWLSPEMIKDYKCTTKAVIWSLGITAIEMATGKTPLADKPPLCALLSIPRKDAPALPLTDEDGEYEHWSDHFREFVDLCLKKDLDKRPSAEELLQHEWFQSMQCTSDHDFSGWINSIIPSLDEWRSRTRAEKELSPFDYSEDEYNWNDGDDDYGYGTMIVCDENNENDRNQTDSDWDDDVYGTMIMCDENNRNNNENQEDDDDSNNYIDIMNVLPTDKR